MRDLLRTACLLAAGLALSACRTSGRCYEPELGMADLVASVPSADNSYLLLTTAPTRGRFACGLAIAKFLPRAGDGPLALSEVKPNEQAYWTERLRGLSAIREVVFLDPINTRSVTHDAAGLCAAAGRLEARLLLIYAPNRFAANSAQVLGVLYDVPRRQPIATLHASACFAERDGRQQPPEDRAGDQRAVDAAYQAPRAFERLTRACLLELARRDEHLPTTQPHRWAAPKFDERWWIPTRVHIR